MTDDEEIGASDTLSEDVAPYGSAIPIIEWHGEMLKQRAENLRNGTDRFISLEEAKARICEKTGRETGI